MAFVEHPRKRIFQTVRQSDTGEIRWLGFFGIAALNPASTLNLNPIRAAQINGANKVKALRDLPGNWSIGLVVGVGRLWPNPPKAINAQCLLILLDVGDQRSWKGCNHILASLGKRLASVIRGTYIWIVIAYTLRFDRHRR